MEKRFADRHCAKKMSHCKIIENEERQPYLKFEKTDSYLPPYSITDVQNLINCGLASYIIYCDETSGHTLKGEYFILKLKKLASYKCFKSYK